MKSINDKGKGKDKREINKSGTPDTTRYSNKCCTTECELCTGFGYIAKGKLRCSYSCGGVGCPVSGLVERLAGNFFDLGDDVLAEHELAQVGHQLRHVADEAVALRHVGDLEQLLDHVVAVLVAHHLHHGRVLHA